MAEPRDWPIEQPPSLRPWFLSAMGHLSATGHLAILFKTRADAQRAQQSLHARGVPESDVRLYTSEQILDLRRVSCSAVCVAGDRYRAGRLGDAAHRHRAQQ
jgi:hypothetical protein